MLYLVQIKKIIMTREIFSADQLPHKFSSVKKGRDASANQFDSLTEVGQWFFIPQTDMTESQIKHNYRPQAPCRLVSEGKKYKTMKGHFGPNEELGIAVQRVV